MATAEAESINRGYQRLSVLFRPRVLDGNKCFRCKEPVYHAEKIGPVHEVVFHRNCFRCIECGQHLTIKNFCVNQVDPKDKEVYCQNHYPRVGAARIDDASFGIRGAVMAQNNYRRMSKKLDPQVRKPGTVRIPNIDVQAVAIRRVLATPKAQEYTRAQVEQVRVSLGLESVSIQQDVQAQKMRANFQPKLQYKKKLEDAQRRLEEELRKEEDELFKTFKQEREREKRKLSDEMNKEWEVKLKELTSMYEKEEKKKNREEKQQLTIHFENKKKDLERSLKLKKVKKEMYVTVRLKQKEQEATANLVEKQSQQMLELLAAKKQELKQELEKELQTQTDIHHIEQNDDAVKEIVETLEVLEGQPVQLPTPHPPSCRKNQIYTDPNIFGEIDNRGVEVAQNEQISYTDLVNQLTDGLLSDLEKVRAIYRWLTVKDLNQMEFEDELQADTPMGLLRGIKYGTETYHVLFMRLCSYAGMHCKEIKGHSKSVGYEPGMKIEPDKFQNTWNAVLIDDDWRFIQCNWGARHLVLNKDKKKEGKRDESSKDKIRYQYDEHYFLTDPDEFIQEFWPLEKEWQLLEAPITLEEFEALPFVRSVFFHYGMQFDRALTGVLEADNKGGTTVRIKIPEKFENELVFFYQLRFADKERQLESTYKGVSLERFVFQTMLDNMVMFSVNVPTSGDFFFEIFANRIDESNKITQDSNGVLSPFRLKCACKFKITCRTMDGKMHPLPDCASGEWGPKKAFRHFGIIPVLSNELDNVSDSGSTSSTETPENPKAGIVNVENSVDLKLKIPMPLQFVAKLKFNNVETKVLDPFVMLTVQSGILTVSVTVPQVGQYGLDIYAKPKEAKDSNTLSHACKYLLNAIKVDAPVELPKVDQKIFARRGSATVGPLPICSELGLKAVSHKDPQIICQDTNKLTVEFFAPTNLEVSYKFMREPDDDCRQFVTMVREGKDNTAVKFIIKMEKRGCFLLSIYARNRDAPGREMPNVFNYMINHKVKATNMGFQVKIEEKKSSGGLFKKSFFGSKKDKSKEKEKDKSKEKEKDKQKEKK